MRCYLVTYDTPNDRRRAKIASLLEDYGQRVQFSVFEIWLGRTEQRDLMKRLEKLVDEAEDSVRLYRLCEDCQAKVITLGQGEPPEEPGVIII